MPVLLAENTVTLEFADLYKRRPITRPALPAPRAAGIHQSGVLRAVAQKIGVLKPGEGLEEDMPWIMAVGMMWEEWAASLYPDMEWQPGELTVDGVSVNCDGLSMMVGCDRCGDSDFAMRVCPTCGDGKRLVPVPFVEEFKATYKRVRTGEEMLGEWLWMHQGRSYCYCYGASVVRWHVMYVKGDWTDKSAPFGPVVKQYVVRFSEKEIEQTWRLIQNNKHLAVPEGAAETK